MSILLTVDPQFHINQSLESNVFKQYCLLLFTDPQMQIWVGKAIQRQKKARADGTRRNADYTIKEYLRFTHTHKVFPTSPSTLSICAYIEMQVEKQLCPATIRNKLSQIKVWIRSVKGSVAQLDDDFINDHLKAVYKTSTYMPNVKEPVPVQVLKEVLAMLPKDPEGWVLRGALLCVIYGGFRQCEVLPPSKDKFSADTCLTREDVLISPQEVHIKKKKGKNHQSYGTYRAHVFKVSENPDMCVVLALNNIVSLIPSTDPSDPMFAFPHDGSPMPVTYLRRKWKESLVKLHQDDKKYSLHSIRKTLVTESYLRGVPVNEIKDFGKWSTKAYENYFVTKAD